LSVTFDEAVRAITPGQSVVLYDDDCVIGGGIITAILPSS
ncbi:MAG: aminomethyltransferase beta-barrel domain-containing protein, partial [Peptococcaceae bacterium]